jgi:hypothetical protein
LSNGIKKDTFKVNISQVSVFLIVIFIISYLIPFVVLNSSKALQTGNNLLIFSIYGGILAFSFLLVAVLQLTENMRDENSWINTFLHDPSKGLINQLLGKDLPNSVLFWAKSAFIMFWMSIGFSLIIGFLFATVGSTALPYATESFTGIPSDFGNIYLAGENSATAETFLFQAIFVGLLWGSARYIAKGNKAILAVLAILVLFVGTLIPVIGHVARYGTDEGNIIGVASLFGLTNLILILTGSIIFPLVFHDSLNWVWKAKALLANNEFALYGTLGVLFILWLVSTILYFIAQARKNKYAQTA